MSEHDDAYQRRRAEQRVGRVLSDKWQLESLLGVGGMAAVYAARHRNGSRVAIKILHAEVAADERMRNRFLHEGYVANKVEHAGVATVLDDGVDEDGTAFIVMELLEGDTAEDLRVASGGRLAPRDVLVITEQLLEVLAAAHAKAIVHRDLKPDNIFVTRSGDLKILDFGIARVRELGLPSSGTRTGVPMGTPSFMPPEQARGRWDLVDERSDLWAVGASMFTCLTGKLVHDAETLAEMIASALKPVPPIRTRAPDIPPSVAAIVDRALAFDKAKRWPNASEMRHAVHEAMLAGIEAPAAVSSASMAQPAGYAATIPSNEFEPAARARPVGRRLGIILAAFIGAVVVLVAALLWNQGSSDRRDVAASVPEAPSAEPSVTAPPEASPTAIPAPPEPSVSVPRPARRPYRPTTSATASSAPKPRPGIGPVSEDL